MDERHREFLDDLLATPSPSGFEADVQRVWVEYVSEFADEVRTDEYGNAVAVVEGSAERDAADRSSGQGPRDGDPAIAFTGHADEIGLMVNSVDEDGFVRLSRVGGTDRTVSKGQHVEIHTDDGVVRGVVGQTAIHLRDPEDEELEDIAEQHVDIGAETEAEARELVDVGDPITFDTPVRELQGTRMAARGMDNRVGIWVAAEAARRAAEADVDATVYAVSTVQEELGKQGAKMVGFDLPVDAALAVDVTHAVDSPDLGKEKDQHGEVELGAGPVVARGSSNHPEVVRTVREAAAERDLPVQLQAAGRSTGTDADAFYTSQGGIPSLNVGLPNRYMHTPVEVIDTEDLNAAADLLAAFAAESSGRESFSVDI
ncbi:M20/M25/M40 family metallo-hydrolase [Halorussus limi]|uniref:M20/M25/M40 family metallo-hydrolase n=1 Tax=Halorussus limi TaxID=2938695 RepID=A0A8U0HVB3_9EURY|nr:M20/M25/M40 family metallo-hydrolase [Halorussus limi]UPV74564.1 M20/M25/M40 family metallo-hydrolase [Halorussus limi]